MIEKWLKCTYLYSYECQCFISFLRCWGPTSKWRNSSESRLSSNNTQLFSKSSCWLQSSSKSCWHEEPLWKTHDKWNWKHRLLQCFTIREWCSCPPLSSDSWVQLHAGCFGQTKQRLDIYSMMSAHSDFIIISDAWPWTCDTHRKIYHAYLVLYLHYTETFILFLSSLTIYFHNSCNVIYIWRISKIWSNCNLARILE